MFKPIKYELVGVNIQCGGFILKNTESGLHPTFPPVSGVYNANDVEPLFSLLAEIEIYCHQHSGQTVKEIMHIIRKDRT